MKNTEQQIQNIKEAYNFGVEVEMYGITREEASKLASNYFGTGRYADTANTNGLETWSAYDSLNREWKFSLDCSILGQKSEKCELITPVLEYSDIPVLQELLQILRHHGAISNPSFGCGVHIHVSRKDGFAVQDIKNLVNIMASHENQLAKAINVDESRLDEYCQMVEQDFLELLHTRKLQTMADLEDAWYKTNCDDDSPDIRRRHYNRSRYHMLNLHSLFHGHKTVEFRLFQFANPTEERQGGIDTDEMKTFVQLCLAMCELAHQVKYASAIPQQDENEKYAFRCWLLRLGFIGEEFKTARRILLRNMEGNCAWRRVS